MKLQKVLFLTFFVVIIYSCRNKRHASSEKMASPPPEILNNDENFQIIYEDKQADVEIERLNKEIRNLDLNNEKKIAEFHSKEYVQEMRYNDKEKKELTATRTYHSKSCDYDVYYNLRGASCSFMIFAGTIGKGKSKVELVITDSEELFVKIMEKGVDVCKTYDIVRTEHLKISPLATQSTELNREVRSSKCNQ